MNAVKNKKTIRLLTIYTSILCLTVLGIGILGYAQSRSRTTRGDACNRIMQIIDLTLKQGEGNFNGVRTYTRVPVSTLNVEEVKKGGKQGIPCVVGVLSSGKSAERRVAIDLLGTIGGPEVVEHLGRVVDQDPLPTLRLVALGLLANNDDPRVQGILHHTAQRNADDEVRAEARKLLFERNSKKL